jgi:hypothetical protein
LPVTLETIGSALALASLAAAAAAAMPMRRTTVGGMAAIVFGGALVPIGGMSAAGYALAVPGPLSAATLVLVAQSLLRALGVPVGTRPSDTFLVCAVVGGVLLYPAAAGFMAFDLYDLGFRGIGVPALMSGFVVLGWVARAHDVAIWIGGAALLYLAGAYASVNVWDYLMDPVAFLAAIVILAMRMWQWRAQPRANLENSATTRS